MELTQPSQPLLSILNLSNTRVSVFPEVKEFAEALCRAGLVVYALEMMEKHPVAPGRGQSAPDGEDDRLLPWREKGFMKVVIARDMRECP